MSATLDIAQPTQPLEPQIVTDSPQLLPLTAERKLLCVDVLVRTGGNISKAAELLGTTRQNIHRWAQTDPAFRELFEHALEYGTDNLEESYYQRAISGSDRATEFLLKARRPEKYRDVQVGEPPVTGATIATEVVSLLVQLAERNRAAQLNAQLGVDGPVDHVQLAGESSVGQVDGPSSSSSSQPIIDVNAATRNGEDERP